MILGLRLVQVLTVVVFGFVLCLLVRKWQVYYYFFLTEKTLSEIVLFVVLGVCEIE